MVVDDNELLCRGIEVSLKREQGMELVGQAANGPDAVALCAELRPDVVLMDLMLPGIDGVDATHAILERYDEVRVIALSGYCEPDLVHRALRAGAISYIVKDGLTKRDLFEAIRAAHEGRSTLSHAAAGILVQAAREGESEPALGHDLTPREHEVLDLMVKGRKNNEIATELEIALGTARIHVSNILKKLDAGNRSEAIALAVHQGLASWEPRS